ncbi:Lrp/AsnC family transcriptional regulator [Microbacterium rhizomatis]|uniref:Lrp/AsnC family transcriptional regulator n=1 Tax=Microbacterium rhizomatis TaxID=1631477 RepID=A0A5J5IYM5_9MICO|nr:Lrp/AsnC family transcriptional regulator [Microbacterium rhizomatis]KAA9106566.1 Lrp/AsnC family transcriptional regulator [Microbacterium rhizomatis]
MASSQSDGERPDPRPLRSPMSNMTREVEKPRPVVELDEIDRKLLFLLADDPRVSQRQLAREVGMSPPAVGERIARLERQRVIRGYTTIVDWSALGYPGLVYIPMTLATDAVLSEILAELRSIAELTELVVVTGSFDMIARFRIRDHAHLQALLLDRIWPIRGLQRIETFLSLGEVVRERSVRELLEGSLTIDPTPEDDD